MMTTAKFKALNSSISLSAIHQRMVVYALNETEELTHIDSVYRGKSCKCRCLSCGESLIARQGELKSHSFAHESGTECRYAVETMLQWLAKELISAQGFFVTPELAIHESLPGPVRRIEARQILPSKKVTIDSAQLEKRTHRTRPDLVLSASGHELLVEIAITKNADARRLASIEQHQLSTVEIDLSKNHVDTVADFERILFTNSGLKRWLFNVKEVAIRNKLQEENSEKLALQNIEYEQTRAKKEALEAAEKAQQREITEQQQKREQEKTHTSTNLAAIIIGRPGLTVDRSLSTIYYRTEDGGIWILRGPSDSVYIMADGGDEQALKVLHEIGGVNYDAVNRCYSAPNSQLPLIMTKLQPFVKSARSISGNLP